MDGIMDFVIEKGVLKKYVGKGGDVKIPSEVTTIGNEAFYHCDLLTSVTIPDNVTEIGRYAFWRCDNLTRITLGRGIVRIDYSAFLDCRNLTGVYINDMVAWCNICFYSPYANPLTYAHNLYLNNKAVTELVIPDEIKRINAYTFFGCRTLTSVVIPNSVTMIEQEAFRECVNLQKMMIGKGITDIAERPFNFCEKMSGVYITDIEAWCNINFRDYDSNPLYYAHNLYLNNRLVTELVIPNEVTKIKAFAFYGWEGLSVAIPNDITSIGGKVFKNGGVRRYNKYDNACYLGNADNPYCYLIRARSKTIKTCKIHQDCKIISDFAFEGCNNLTDIAIPDCVTHIGFSAFRNCSKLACIMIDDCNSAYKAMDGVLYSKDSELLILYPQDHSNKSFVIPQEVRSIEDYSFWRCNNLEEISILGKNLRFSNCCKLGNNDRLRKVISYASDAENLNYFKCKRRIVLDLRALPFTVIKANIMKESSMFCYMENCINGIEYSEDVAKKNDAYIKRIRTKLYKNALERSSLMRYMTSKKIFDLQDSLIMLENNIQQKSPESKELLMDYIHYCSMKKTMPLERAMELLEKLTERTSVTVKAYLMDYINSFDEEKRQKYIAKQERKIKKDFSLD